MSQSPDVSLRAPESGKVAQIGCQLSKPAVAKIVILVLSLLAIGTAVGLHFYHVNAIAVYTVGGAGGLALIAVALYSLISQKTNPQIAVTEDEVPNEQTLPQPFVSGLKSLKKDTSHVYVDVSFKHKEKTYEAGWYPLSFMSFVSGFSDDPEKLTDLQKNAEREFGPFMFALSFSNCHTTIPMEEPLIVMDDPMTPGVLPFHNVEFYFQYYKCALYAASLTDPSEKKKLTDLLNSEITNPIYKDPNKAYLLGQKVKLEGKVLETWDKIKEEVMTAAIYVKFKHHPHLGEMLKATAPHQLVQLKTDPIWGPGKDGKGRNLLGVCLMNVRTALINGQRIAPPSIPAQL